LLYNLRTDFAPLAYQWGHTMAGGEHSARHFPEFVGVQLLLIGGLPFALLPWVLARARTWWAGPRLRACFCLSALPLLFFLAKALRGPLEGNWPLPAYVGFWPLAAHWLAEGGASGPGVRGALRAGSPGK